MASVFKIKPDATYLNVAGESYTVPAGKWAIAKVQVESGGVCTIDSKIALKSVAYSVIKRGIGNLWMRNADNNTGSGANTAALRSESSFLSGFSFANATAYVMGTLLGLTATPANNSTTQASGLINEAYDPVFGNSTASTSEASEFSLLPGQVITGTSGATRIYIEEFVG